MNARKQIEAFDDTWHWGDEAESAFDGVMKSGNTGAAEMLRALRLFLKENDMMAYLSMMAVRLLELRRVMKPTGSLYLHCDPTASHYLKILMDGIFGVRNFRNEIIWKRKAGRGETNNPLSGSECPMTRCCFMQAAMQVGLSASTGLTKNRISQASLRKLTLMADSIISTI